MAETRCSKCGHRWDDVTHEEDGVWPVVNCPVCGETGDWPTLASDTPVTAEDNTATSISPASGTAAAPRPRSPSPLPDQLPPTPGYILERELGRGGMGVVYLAHDIAFERDVALKILSHVQADSVQRFKTEFRALTDIAHPNVANFYELVGAGETWFFSMELLEGVDFLQYVRHGCDASNSLGVDEPQEAGLTVLQLLRLRRGLAQLSLGLAALHAKGIIHRDIKPSNVLVTREERVVLLDFGLVVDLEKSRTEGGADRNVMGTILYMSPEQAGARQLTYSSDWYSVGVMLYEALTGEVPFIGELVQVLMDKQRRLPRRPRQLVPSTPEDLDRLCMSLLQRFPADRPSGEEVIQQLYQTNAWRNVLHTTPVLVPSSLLVGRERHMKILSSCLEDVKQGQPVTLFLQGRSGMGKSALALEFLERVRVDPRVLVLSGRCYQQESMPFKALDSLVDALARHLHRLTDAEVEPLLPRDWEALTRIFPVLGDIGPPQERPYSGGKLRDQQELRQRAFGALREILSRIGTRQPLVLCIDDLQWGDEDSAALLAYLLQPPDPPLMLLLGTYRAEDADTSPFLKMLQETRRKATVPWEIQELAIEPLAPDESRQLALSLLENTGEEAARHAELIAQEGGGSPYFVQELVRHVVSQGRVDWSVRINLDEVLWSRVRQLPANARRLLEVLAVASRALPVRTAFRAADVGMQGPELLQQLRLSHFVRSAGIEGEPQIETYHDRIRETVGRHLESTELIGVHRKLASILEAALQLDLPALSERLLHARPSERPALCAEVRPADWQHIFHLARHHDAVGDHHRAMAYALLAGERARSQYSLETAEQHFRMAERGLQSAEQDVAYHIVTSCGEVLMLRGKYEEARDRFLTSRQLSQGDLARAETDGELGELAFKQGDMKTASEAIERALKSLGRPMPRSTLGMLPLLLREGTVQLLHTLLPRWFLAKRSLDGAQRDLLAVRLLSRLSYTYWFENSVFAVTAQLRAMNLIELYPATAELARVYAEHAVAMSLLPYARRGIAYAQRSWEIRQQFGDLWGQAHALHLHGILLYALSRYTDCIAKCREAIQLFEQAGDFWEVNMARYQVAASLYRLGRLREAADEARRLRQSGLDLGDVQAMALGLDVWSKATRGQLSADIIQAALQQQQGDDVQTASMVWQAEGVRLFYQSDYTAAAAAFRRAFEVARKAGIKNTYTTPSLPWLASALRCAAEQIAASNPRGARRLLRQAWRTVRRGRRLARRFQNDLPHVLREAALVAAQLDWHRQARRLFEESLRVSERQDARYERALTLRARGHVGLRLNWADAAAEIAAANESLRTMQRTDSAHETLRRPGSTS